MSLISVSSDLTKMQAKYHTTHFTIYGHKKIVIYIRRHFVSHSLLADNTSAAMVWSLVGALYTVVSLQEVKIDMRVAQKGSRFGIRVCTKR